MKTNAIHPVTAMAGPAQRNVDDPGTWHPEIETRLPAIR